MFTPSLPSRNPLAASSDLITLQPAIISQSGKTPPMADSLEEAYESMALPHLYSCFDTHGKGHFRSADELFDNGIWIGYLADES